MELFSELSKILHATEAYVDDSYFKHPLVGNGAGITMAKSGLTIIRDVSPGGVPKSKYKFLYLVVLVQHLRVRKFPRWRPELIHGNSFSGKTMVVVNNNGEER